MRPNRAAGYQRKEPKVSKLSAAISLVLHALIIGGLVFFAAREGMLGKQLKKIAVTMVPKEKPPEKPKPDAGPKPRINKLFVDAKSQAFLDSEPFSLPALRDRLQQLKAAEPELGVVVRGADEVDYQNMVNVLDLLHQLQITKVGLATEAMPSAR